MQRQVTSILTGKATDIRKSVDIDGIRSQIIADAQLQIKAAEDRANQEASARKAAEDALVEEKRARHSTEIAMAAERTGREMAEKHASVWSREIEVLRADLVTERQRCKSAEDRCAQCERESAMAHAQAEIAKQTAQRLTADLSRLSQPKRDISNLKLEVTARDRNGAIQSIAVKSE